MARIPYPVPDATSHITRVADEVRAQRDGALPNLYRALLHAPPVCDGWLRLGTAVRYESTLPPSLRELATCLVATRTGSAYEWGHHAPLARRAGVTDQQLAALVTGLGDAPFDERERACLELVRCVVDHDAVPDELFARVHAHLGDRGTVELVALAAYYSAVARFLAVLDVDVEDDVEQP